MGPVPGPTGERVGYARMYCKAWDCAYCGPRKAARVCKLIAAAAKAHGLNRFLTLTLDPKKCTGEENKVRYIRDVWRKFRVYLTRKHGNTVEFISVLEEHKSGIPHLHVLVDRYIKQAWISGAWNALGGGRIADIRFVADLDKIGYYLGKYLSKEMLLGHGPGVRRYSTSRGVKLIPKKEKTAGWCLAPAPVEELLRVAGADASDIVEDSRGAVKWFTTEKPIKRLKAFGGELRMVSPIPVYVDPDEADGALTLEEIKEFFPVSGDEEATGAKP